MNIKGVFRTRKRAAIFCSFIGLFLIGCCGMFQCADVVIVPPLIPGAEYVGDETCKSCHCEQFEYFNLSDHSNVSLMMEEECGGQIHAESCETCHGPGSLHVQGGGDKTQILRADPDTCFACHLNIKGMFNLQYHHPVPEGRMVCSDCHSMHGHDVHSMVSSTHGISLENKDEICLTCHKAQRGPFAFEHEALRDGCTTCHNPHGAIVDRLLVAGPTTLCLSCHFESAINSNCQLGSSGHGGRSVGIGASCLDCHTRVHGSNAPSTSLRD